MRARLVVVAMAAWAMQAPSGLAATGGLDAAAGWFIERGYVPPQGGLVIACHGYGCSRRLPMVTDDVLASAAHRLKAAGSATTERQALGDIVRLYKAEMARRMGGSPDVGGSPPQMSGRHGQMDCLDETANTTSLLIELDRRGMLLHHSVQRPQSRGFFIDGRYPHVTAVISEKTTQSEWAVDPWKYAPGHAPDILPLSRWRQDF